MIAREINNGIRAGNNIYITYFKNYSVAKEYEGAFADCLRG